MTTETTTDLITAEEAGKLAHKYRFANNDLERVLCETARTVIALHAQLVDAQAAQALVVERAEEAVDAEVAALIAAERARIVQAITFGFPPEDRFIRMTDVLAAIESAALRGEKEPK